METIEVRRDDGLVTVTMHRPDRKNALSVGMIAELTETFLAIEESREDRALLLTGAGGAFCSGADLGEPAASADMLAFPVPRMRRLGDLAVALHRISKPTLAKVDGAAVGAGLGLALGCDLVVASDRARFSTIFAKRGLSLDNGSSWLLPRLVGMARAKELAFFGDMLSAQEALDIGLINRVVPADELDPAADAWARRLASGPTGALSFSKRLLRDSWGTTLEAAVEREGQSQALNFKSADTAEAVAAFRERRDPVFTGR